jgi:hypothetical protein
MRYLTKIVPLLILGFSSCINDLDFNKFEELKPGPNVAIPILKTTIKLTDFVNQDSILTEDPDGFLRFIHEQDSIFFLDAGELVEIPNQPLAENLPLIAGLPAISLDLNLNSIGGMNLSTLNLNRAAFNWYFENPTNEPASVKISFGNASVNGVPFEFTIQSQGQGRIEGLDFYNDLDFNLAQSPDPNAAPYNNLNLSVELQTPASVAPGTQYNFGMSLDSVKFERVIGYFGQRVVNIPSSSFDLDLGSIGDFTSGFTLTDPKLTLEIKNGMGVSMGTSLGLDGVNIDGDIFQLTMPSFEIIQPSVPGTISTSSLTLDNQNSNVVSFIDGLPTTMVIAGGVTLNPNNTGGTTNFISTSDRFYGNLIVDLPLEIKTSRLSFNDILEVDLFESEDAVEFFELDIVSENGFPLDVELVLFFLDAAGQATDSVFFPFAQAAPVDGNGRVTAPRNTNATISFDQERIKTMIRSKQWRLEGRLATTDNGTVPVKFYSDYELSVQIGARTRVILTEI